MQTPPHETRQRGRIRNDSTGPLYVFFVTGMAVFLVGLAVLRSPHRQFRASARVICETPGVTGASAADAAPIKAAMEKAASPNAFLRIAPKLGSALGPTNATNLPEWAKSWSERTLIERAKAADHATVVTIRFWHRDSRTAVAVVTQLADQFVRDAYLQSGATPASGREQEATARQQEVDAARLALDRYLSEQSDRIILERFASRFLPEATSAGRPAEKVRNPEHLRLRDELASARSAVEHLLIHRDPTNDLVIQAEKKRDALEQQLAEQAEFLDASAADDALLVRSMDRLTTEERGIVRAAVESTPRFQELQTQLSDAQRHYINTAMNRTGNEEVERAATISCRINGRMEVDQWRGGRPARRDIHWLAMFSCGIGFAFCLLRRSPALATLQSADDIRHGFGLDVIAVLQTRDGPRRTRSILRHFSPAKWGTIIGELIVVAVVGLLITLAVMEKSFAAQLLRDPFAAYGLAVDRVVDWL